MLIRKYQQSGKILDKLGDAWNNFWNYQLNVPLSNGTQYGNPFFTGTSNKEPYTYKSTPKTEVAQHTAMLLPLSINDKLKDPTNDPNAKYHLEKNAPVGGTPIKAIENKV